MTTIETGGDTVYGENDPTLCPDCGMTEIWHAASCPRRVTDPAEDVLEGTE
jgi:predicted RNA-binding Zn-ribbon protein involved in translation (DUF1610 family)